MSVTCLRLLAGKHFPEGTVTWNTVLSGTENDGHCPAFAEIMTERMAYGLGELFDHVEQNDYKTLKQQVMDYLGGHSTYYRYHRGEKLLSESQQEHIRQLLASYGYTKEPVFGGYSKHSFCKHSFKTQCQHLKQVVQTLLLKKSPSFYHAFVITPSSSNAISYKEMTNKSPKLNFL